MGNAVLISQVGHQPGAVAVAAKTLHTEIGLAGVLLLRSGGPRGTGKASEALKRYLEVACPGVWVRGMAVAPEDELKVTLKVREAAAEHPGLEFLYDCTPGANFRVAKLALGLKGVPNLRALYSDFGALWSVGETRDYPSRSIGLEELLALHGLTCSFAGEGNGIRRGVEIRDGTGRLVFRFDEAYELRGRLFGLVSGVDAPGRAREIVAGMKDAERANGLRPQVLALCGRSHDADRLRAANVQAFLDPEVAQGKSRDYALRKLALWRAMTPEEPGVRTPGQAEDSAAVPQTARGAGGDGPPLLVCLGNDPSSTLAALCSQRPREACILYDRQTPYVVALARRLEAAAGNLPVGSVRFRPVTHTGKGIDNALVRAAFEGAREVVANVTPGTKAQSWALAQLEGVKLCSLRNDERRVERLEAGGSGAAVPGSRWATPPTLVQAEVCGGRLHGVAAEQEHFERNRRFLEGVVKVVAGAARRREKSGGAWLRAARELGDGRASLRCRDAGEAIAVEVRLPGETLQGTLRGPLGEGFWLEEVAAAAFVAAGARDVCTGLKWEHLDGRVKPQSTSFRTDLDVAFQWAEGFAGVSVKQNSPPPEKLDAVQAEILAVAKEGLGRFCLPVLVRPIPPAEATVEAALAAHRERGVLEIAVSMLDQPEQLARALDGAFAQKRTL